jgi:hypothetical protein
MKTSTKIILCAIIACVAYFVIAASGTSAHILANSSMVGQMQNTDSSYVQATSVGNGETILHWVVGVVAGLSGLFVITRKPPKG